MNASEVLRKLGKERPLVHHLTNYVTVNLVANATLATGALPVMANAVEEVEEMAATASALVITGALAYFGMAGEVAAGATDGPGTFEPRLLDALAALAADPAGLDGRLAVEELPLA